MARAELKPVFDFCEQNGFEINENDPFQLTFTIKKKDVWDNVEFFLGADGIIRKIPDEETLNILKKVKLLDATPSTESAYIEQLKKECFDRFGEIKEGDRFEEPIKASYWVVNAHDSKSVFKYLKDEDAFMIGGLIVYKQGRWATRVKERVEVKLISEHKYCDSLMFKFDTGFVNETKGIGEFLASQLEKYLNKE